MVTASFRDEAKLRERGEQCIGHIARSFAARPEATGIATFDYRPTDVVVTTFPKSGTTLTQHMAYQIAVLSRGGPALDRTGLEFPDLSAVSPWLDYIPAIGVAPPSDMCPRVLKTHSPVSAFSARPSKHVVIVRNPVDYPASWLDFVFDAMVPGAAALGSAVRNAAFHACVRHDLLCPVDSAGLGRWHHFVRHSVLPPRPNTLVLFYDDITADMHSAVHALARFMHCRLAPCDVDRVVARCDRKRMADDSRFACKIENKCFGITSDLMKAKPLRRDGFKRFALDPDELRRLEDMHMNAFGVRTFKELKSLIKSMHRSLPLNK